MISTVRLTTINGRKYLSARQYAAVCDGTMPDEATYDDVRRYYHLLEGGKVEGAIKANSVWLVPLETAVHEVEEARLLAIKKALALAELVGGE